MFLWADDAFHQVMMSRHTRVSSYFFYFKILTIDWLIDSYKYRNG